ncbi:Cgr1 family-domain-containing protein [Schizophyllum commune]|nr:Cgr1-domain-containing protein [Schizophyllum commune Tattone D]
MGDAITPLIAGPSPEQYFASPLFVRSRLHLACALRTTHLAMEPAPSTEATPVVELASSSGGRVSGKAWKPQKKATVRSHIQEGVRTKNWEDRMEKEKKAQAIKKLQAELKEEQEAERKARIDRIKERRAKAEERERIEMEKAKMGARKAARLRRRQGRTKKINH